jgi:hypothetical protein
MLGVTIPVVDIIKNSMPLYSNCLIVRLPTDYPILPNCHILKASTTTFSQSCLFSSSVFSKYVVFRILTFVASAILFCHEKFGIQST